MARGSKTISTAGRTFERLVHAWHGCARILTTSFGQRCSLITAVIIAVADL
jgi:hypothetical protein